MNTFKAMRIIIILFFSPFLLVSQEFYPGSLADLNAPICYNTSAILTFENLPTAGTEGDYSYQWQKSWNGSPWFNITNANSISYETNNLTTDTDFRVLVTQDNINLPTNRTRVVSLNESRRGRSLGGGGLLIFLMRGNKGIL